MAHALGRLGCLMAGCCHGAYTDEWYGIYMPALNAKVVPLQLYEAIFLFALFALFVYRVLKNKSGNLPLYMALYGVWRFVIEFFRSDDRGETLVDFLSPSQFIALLMIVGAVALFFVQRYIVKKQLQCESEVADGE
jgi:phosphatidylglycerol:prolipoprotein diacylglycerol transferase